MQNVFTNNVSILINDQPISQEFHLYEAGYEKCRPTKPTEFAPLIIGFCIIVAMVKVIFNTLYGKTTHYRWRFVYDSSQLSQYLLS